MEMMKRVFFVIITLMMLSGMQGMDKAQAAENTDETVQQIPEGYTPIYNIADLYAVRNNLDGNYILMNDIDMTEDTKEGGDWDQGNGWTPIETFSGIFDGNGYRIIGMHIYGDVSTGCVGLFGEVDGATIKNLGLVNVDIDVESYHVGGIVGYVRGTSTSNILSCYCSGTIRNNCSTACYTGGICGYGTISEYGTSYGQFNIVNCINLSAISANSDDREARVGGIISGGYWSGSVARIYIQNCYNIGNVSGIEAYAIGASGGFCENYYLKDGVTKGWPSSDEAGACVGLTESQMKYKSVYSGFDFDSVWEVDPYCGYPYPQLKGNRVVRVDSVKLQKLPAKLIYNQGDKLDLSGTVVEITYEDGITTTIPVSEDMLSGYDINEIGRQTVTVTYGGVKTSFDIEVKEVPVSSITIPKTVSIYRSKTYQMVADILPVNASDKTITWESKDANIVSVDANGLLKAKAKGKTKIIATTSNGLVQECEVTVLVASAVVTLNQTEVTLKLGESTTLTAQITPLESTDTITWESTNAEIAEVTDGVVVARKEGVVTISAYTESGVRAGCKVTIKSNTEENDTADDEKPASVGTTMTISAYACKVKVLSSNATAPTVEYVATTNKKGTSIVIPNTVTFDGVIYKVVRIAAGAFKNNKKITKVTIGNNVTAIESNAFSGCTKLKTVSMGANVTTIGAKAFYKCTALAKITIPAKVNKIGKQAFYGCKKLKKITIKTTKLTNKTVGSKAFKGIHPKAAIKVPKKKLSSYKEILKKKGVGSKVKINK